MVRSVIGVIAAILATSQPISPPNRPLFAGTELVSLTATVTDRRGQHLTDLSREDFEILEDGKPRKPSSSSRAGDDLETGPDLHIGLLFDTSGSMDADIKMSRSAAIKFLNTMNYARDMTLVDFDTEGGHEIRPAGLCPAGRTIRSRKPEGFTAMYDALGVYLDGAAEVTGRKILVVFTDGGDTCSAIRFGDAMTLIRASDVMVYAIGFLQSVKWIAIRSAPG